MATMIPSRQTSAMHRFLNVAFQFLSRWSYYVNLLGIKIPLGLVVRASHASVRFFAAGVWVWHLLLAMWITIPLIVVGNVVLSAVRTTVPVAVFVSALASMVVVHWIGVPLIQPTQLGSISLQLMFILFEDLPILAWLWCLFYVVRLQDYFKNRQSDASKLLEMKEENVLIVGNAPNVTEGKPLGDEIDGFSHVVRFNTYSVDMPEYTGSKVTYHFCNGRNLPSNVHVKAVMPLFNASLTHAAYLFFPHMEDACATCANLMSSKVDAFVIGEERILELCRKINCNFWQIPTSGMVAIDTFLTLREKVTLHGFNFFTGKKIHYFEESPTQLITSWLERLVTHNPPCEKRYVESLIKDGKASFLGQPQRSGSESTGDSEETMADKEAEKRVREKERKLESNGPRQRQAPGFLRMVLKDGVPSQFPV